MMNFFKFLFGEERGNANAEMCILLPVYMLMTYGMFFMGELGLAQQAAEKSARSAAWNPSNTQEAQKVFRIYPFPNQTSPQISPSSGEVNLFSKSDVQKALSETGFSPSSPNGIDLVKNTTDLLNGIYQAHFKRSSATVSFSFGPRGLLDIGRVNIQTYHVVDLPTNRNRTAKSKSGGRHSIEDYTGALGD